MTKKGIILIIILAILLTTIVMLAFIKHNSNIKMIEGNIKPNDSEIIDDNDEFSLAITDVTGFDLEKLKSYELPIIVQIGSPQDEICASMMTDLQKLNLDLRGKAIVKFLDIDKYKELWNDEIIQLDGDTIQLLINNDGTPYTANISEVLGYKIIKDEEGNHIYTIHDGDLTLNEMESILNGMIVK